MYAFINATVVTVDNGIIKNGRVLVKDGRIAAIGNATLDIPKEAVQHDLTGKWLTPGLIDCHAHISNFPEPRELNAGQSDGNECSTPVTPHIRALDALNPNDPAVAKVRAAGFTTCCTLPGSGNIIGGTGIAYKLRGKTTTEMILPGTEQMKMALGENPKSAFGRRNEMPMTRMGNAAVLRKTLFDAKNYAERKEAAAKDKEKVFETNFLLEALQKVIRGEQKVRIHSHRSDDILTACRIAEEFNLDFSIEHCTEGYKVVEALAAIKPFCVVGPVLLGPYKQEIWGLRLENAAELAAAGLDICLTADTASLTYYLPMQVGLLMSYGLAEDVAFKAVTLNPARLLGLGERLGSLTVGKDADMAVFDGHPFSNFSHCLLTVIDGVFYENDGSSLLRVQ
jgi:imidazolonepropionase-like amidohydrolase